MKRIFVSFSIILTLLTPALAFSSSAAAVDIFSHCGNGSANGNPDVCGDADSQGGNNGKNNPVVGIIKSAIQVLSYIIGVGAIIGIVVSGIRLMTAGGDSNAVASARSGLIYSLIGVAVAVLAQTVVVFVLDKVK